jgi:hypothetical protein
MDLYSFINIIYNHKFKNIRKNTILNSDLLKKQHNNYINILLAIDNIPPCFNSTRKNIKEKVDTFAYSIKEFDYYKNEKFYKEGFIDGYNFLLELQKEKRNDTNE